VIFYTENTEKHKLSP